MSTTTITVDAAQVAATIADRLAPWAVASPRLRADRGAIQIDRGLIVEHGVEIPVVRLQLDTEASLGVEVIVRLAEFAADPAGYVRDLLDNFHGIQRAAQQRRSDRQDEVAAVSRLMGGMR